VKLVVKRADIEIASGIVIGNGAGDEISVVPGVVPGSICVRSRFFSTRNFPELSLDEYVREEYSHQNE
jgi:hypothetical protein